MTIQVTRRALLSRVAAVGGIASVTGCLDGPGRTEFELRLRPAGESLTALTDSYVETALTDRRAQHAVDYSPEYKRAVVEELFENGTVDVLQFQLGYDQSFGTTTRPRPVFVERDGTYYWVTERDRTEVTENRWVFYLDLVDETPGTEDTVVTGPPASLSATDQLVVERALEATIGHGQPYDRDDDPAHARGPTFHRGMDPDASALIPRAPFDYVEYGGDYLVPRAERTDVPLTRYTFGIEPVATSRAALDAFVDANLVDARFVADDLSAEAVDILDATAKPRYGDSYAEHGELSPGFRAILDELGMTEHIPEDPGPFERMGGAILTYDERWFTASLTISSHLF
jgi:hypothetical protein